MKKPQTAIVTALASMYERGLNSGGRRNAIAA
jgi:hypothetical protein